MELSSADFAVILILVGAGCLVCFAALWVMLRQVTFVSHRTTKSQLDELRSALKALESKMADLSKVSELQAVAAPGGEVEAPAAAAQAAQREDEEVTPEMLVVIAAAVTAFLGKKVRIRSAKRLASPREVVSSWSQHGRALVHSSHNPRARS